MYRTLLLASLFALLAAPASAALVNGSFEPDAGAPAASAEAPAAIPGWLASAHGIAWVDASGEGFSAPNGDFVVSFVPGSRTAALLEQAFATTPGESYDLVFWLGSRAGAQGSGRAAIRVGIAGTERRVAIDNPNDELLWQAHVVTFTATASTTTLSFRGVRGRNDSAAWLDGVAVQPAATAQRTARDSR